MVADPGLFELARTQACKYMEGAHERRVFPGETAIRLTVCSWATTAQDIERTVAAFIAARGSDEYR